MSTAADIIRRARRLISDETAAAISGFRWSDEELLAWITEGQRTLVTLKPEAYVFTATHTVTSAISRQLLSQDNIPVEDDTGPAPIPGRLIRVEANGDGAIAGTGVVPTVDVLRTLVLMHFNEPAGVYSDADLPIEEVGFGEVAFVEGNPGDGLSIESQIGIAKFGNAAEGALTYNGGFSVDEIFPDGMSVVEGFVIEAFVYRAVSSDGGIRLRLTNGVSFNHNLRITDANVTGSLQGTTTVNLAAGAPITAATWTHVALVFLANFEVLLYVGGVLVDQGTADDVHELTKFFLTFDNAAVEEPGFGWYIDEVRVTRGYRYGLVDDEPDGEIAETITVPVAPFVVD